MKAFIPAFLWSLIIFWLSVQPGINLPESWGDFISWDKVGHFTVYAILTYLLLLGSAKNAWPLNVKTYLTAVLGSIGFGILMECIQYAFFPGRYFENLDILANIIGSIVGFLLFKYFKTH